jgi:hypothetical protein
MTAPRSGGADLGLLVNLCNTCTVRYPDFSVFQYRPTGTTTNNMDNCYSSLSPISILLRHTIHQYI